MITFDQIISHTTFNKRQPLFSIDRAMGWDAVIEDRHLHMRKGCTIYPIRSVQFHINHYPPVKIWAGGEDVCFSVDEEKTLNRDYSFIINHVATLELTTDRGAQILVENSKFYHGICVKVASFSLLEPINSTYIGIMYRWKQGV